MTSSTPPLSNVTTDPETALVSPEQLAQMRAEPWRYGFLALMRRISANSQLDLVGKALLPQHEPFRLGQQPNLAFAPREIAGIDARDGRLHIDLLGLGMLGPNGPLPLHFTEIARERQEYRRDQTLVDFMNLFHHRAFTQFYRAWASAQSTVGLDRPENEKFSFYIASLTGHSLEEIQGGPLPSHARLSASPYLIQEARTPEGLRNTLEQYFGVPVQIEERMFHWMELEPQSVSRIGIGSAMGVNAFLGTTIPDRRCRFRIVLGPLEYEDYLRFIPQGSDLIKLIEWVRAFFGEELLWDLELKIKPESIPPTRLGSTHQFGWTAWMGTPSPDGKTAGVCFEPEQYLPQLRARWKAERCSGR